MLRRARRPVRLPLGLLPLVLLLLLGVQRLARVAFEPVEHVMQLSMPISWAAAQVRMQADGYGMVYYTIPPNLDQRRHWYRYDLIGNNGHDAAMLRAVTERLQRGRNHPAEQVNVRISFAPHTRYGQVVDVLDMLTQLNQKKYALDLSRPEPVLYVFGPRRRGDQW